MVPRYWKAGISCIESDTPVFTGDCGARLTLRVVIEGMVRFLWPMEFMLYIITFL